MICAALGFLAAWCWVGPARTRQIRSVVGRAPTEAASAKADTPMAERPLVRAAVCLVGAAGLGAAIGGFALSVLGALVGGAVSWWVGQLEPASVAHEREEIERDLPLAAELLSACALVGVPIDHAVGLVAQALDGPLATRLRRVATRIDLGADPIAEWRNLGADPLLGALARTLARSAESGAPPADGLARFAADRRRDRRAARLSRARAVGVRSAAPLAACFLPAFMLIGVVPTIVAGFSTLLG